MSKPGTIPTPHVAIGARIRAARKSAGLSHDKLAERAGTGRQHLIKLEKGWHKPGPELMSAIARETGTTVEALEGSAASESDSEAAEPMAQFMAPLMTALEPFKPVIRVWLADLVQDGATG